MTVSSSKTTHSFIDNTADHITTKHHIILQFWIQTLLFSHTLIPIITLSSTMYISPLQKRPANLPPLKKNPSHTRKPSKTPRAIHAAQNKNAIHRGHQGGRCYLMPIPFPFQTPLYKQTKRGSEKKTMIAHKTRLHVYTSPKRFASSQRRPNTWIDNANDNDQCRWIKSTNAANSLTRSWVMLKTPWYAVCHECNRKHNVLTQALKARDIRGCVMKIQAFHREHIESKTFIVEVDSPKASHLKLRVETPHS